MSREETDRQLFDHISSRYAEKDRLPASAIPRKHLLLDALEPLLKSSGDLGTVIDIGCGPGAAAAYLAGLYRQYIGIDQSPGLVREARQFNRENPAAGFLARNIKQPPADLLGSADLILSIGALHHMTELDRVMKSLTSLAKPGGHLVVIEPQNTNPLIQLLRGLRGRFDRAYSTDQIFFRPQQLTGLLARHGLDSIDVLYHGFLATPFAEIVFYPQWLFSGLSAVAARIDTWLSWNLPPALQRMSFKIVVRARFPL